MATIHDVAQRAQVSSATVSRVMNGTRYVDPSIKERVLRAMEELGYRPNSLARSLRGHKTRMIGLFAPDNSNPFFAELARAIEDAGFQKEYSVILCNFDRSKQKFLAYLDVLLSRQIDGLILLSPPIDSDVLKRLCASQLPIVFANMEGEDLAFDEVAVDNERGGYLAGKYLLELGHRRIGCITGPLPKGDVGRMHGFRRALAESGVQLDPEFVAHGDGRYESGRLAMQELLARDLDLTAVFVMADIMAIGAINVLHRANIRVPDQLSIVGFDNIVISSAFPPSITTIAQPITEIGHACVRLLLERIQTPDKERSRILLPTELLIRESCRALATSTMV